jgi:hypothetical protein
MSRAGAVRAGALALVFLAWIIGGIAASTVTPAAAAVSQVDVGLRHLGRRFVRG